MSMKQSEPDRSGGERQLLALAELELHSAHERLRAAMAELLRIPAALAAASGLLETMNVIDVASFAVDASLRALGRRQTELRREGIQPHWPVQDGGL